MAQQNDNIDNMPNQEEEIDLLELARKLWDSRRMLIRWGIARSEERRVGKECAI